MGRAASISPEGKRPHLLWWAGGIFVYGLGTFFESDVTLFGWSAWAFRGWYIVGALLGGLPLAQGTVYLLLKRRTANVLSALVVPAVVASAVCVMLTPLDASLVQANRLDGNVIVWGWVRILPAFLNSYALVFLVGGAILSAWRYSRKAGMRHRFVGNVLIAVGALLPGIGGSLTVAGYVEALYVTELVGILLIYGGYRTIARHASAPSPLDGALPAT